MTTRTAFQLVTVMALWAACYPLIAVGLVASPHVAFAAMRAVIAGVVLLGLARLLGRAMPESGQSWALLALIGFGTTTLGFVGMFHAAEFMAPGMATVVSNVQPLLAAILAQMFLGERLGRRGRLGLIVGFIGILSVAWSGTTSADLASYGRGVAYIGLATLGIAIGNVAMKHIAGHVDALVTIGIQSLIGAIPLSLLSLLTEDLSSVSWSPRFIVVLLALALFGTALGYWLWLRALEKTRLNAANAFTFLVPVFGMAAGLAFFDERIGWLDAFGASCIVVGIAIVQHGR